MVALLGVFALGICFFQDSWTVSRSGDIIGNCWLNQDSNCLSVDVHLTLTMDTLTAIEEYDVLTDSESGDSTASSGQISPR